MKLKVAIFDMDGTLLDSMPGWQTVGQRYLAEKGLTAYSDLREKVKTLSPVETAAFFQREYNIMDTPEEIMAGVNRQVERNYTEMAQVKPGVVEVLNWLKEQGVRMCIATATDRYLVEIGLKRLQLLPYFEKIFTCTEIGKGKSEPHIFQTAMESLGGEFDNTIIFEDALHAVKTAKDAGFTVAAVYDASAAEDAEEIRGLADWYVDGLEQWRRLYEKMRG